MQTETEQIQLIDEIEAELSSHAAGGDGEADFEILRKILLGEYSEQIMQLQGDLDRLRRLLDDIEHQIHDNERLARTISPIIAPAITSSIRESREVMVEALYPIIGQMVVRAVTEAMRDLARRIDHQMRSTLSIQSMTQQLQARVRGVSGGEMTLRSALSFHVQEIFLIHRENGLLLNHLSRDPALVSDSDLISGMLTAIRDFAADAFGRDQEGQLNQIQYGDKIILIEGAQHAYLAVVIEGVEPAGFRAAIREQVIEIEHAYTPLLRDWDGDPSKFSAASVQLSTLMAVTEFAKKAKTPRPTEPLPDLSTDTLFMLIIAIIAALLFGLLIWQLRTGSLLSS